MKAFLASMWIAVTWTANGLAAPPESDESARRFLDMVNRPVVIEPQPSARANVLENRAYRHDVPSALADVYLPRKTSGAVPIMILVHGGVGADLPLRPKDWGLYRSWGRLLASSGFVAIAFNHRLGFPEPMIEEAATDLDSLTAFVRASARKWGGDPDRISIATFSAGGVGQRAGHRAQSPGRAARVLQQGTDGAHAIGAQAGPRVPE
jgi:acetyl esterase/lipase